MKVKDVIRMLEDIDPELEVMLEGYEGGYKQFSYTIAPADYALDAYTDAVWWYGPHERVEYVDNVEKHTVVKGVVLK
jgi:hypothetical protein